METSNTILPGKSQLHHHVQLGLSQGFALGKKGKERILGGRGKTGLKDKVTKVWEREGPTRKLARWAPVVWELHVVPELPGLSLRQGLCQPLTGVVGCGPDVTLTEEVPGTELSTVSITLFNLCIPMR